VPILLTVLREKWGWNVDITTHVQRIKYHLGVGRGILENLGNPIAYDVEGVEPNPELSVLDPPRPDDPFYVATDERDPEAVEVIRREGGVFLLDLLTMEDRHEFGWPLLLTDVRAIVEQSMLAHSAYFCGHLMSSYSGAILNERAVLGADRRTAHMLD
jgi:hypothetical protein